MTTTGIILAAAGESKRLGRPKQLLPFQGTTLLGHAARTAVAADLGPVVAVLGAVGDECRKALEGLNVRTVVNESWAEGMGTSIARGMEALLPEKPDSVIVMLCDQPAVSPRRLRVLVTQQRLTGSEVVASEYAGTTGPPALFTSPCYPRLLSLRGRQGARSLFVSARRMCCVSFPQGELDVDEPRHIPLLREFDNSLLREAESRLIERV